MRVAIGVNGTTLWQDDALSRPVLASLFWYRQNPTEPFGPSWVPERLRSPLLSAASLAEKAFYAVYNTVIPVHVLTTPGRKPVSLSEHLGGIPRAGVGLMFTDAEPWTPTVGGARLLIPRARQGIVAAEVRHGDCVVIRVGQPASMQPDDEPRTTCTAATKAASIRTSVQLGATRDRVDSEGFFGQYVVSVLASPDPAEVRMHVFSSLEQPIFSRWWTSDECEGSVVVSLGGLEPNPA